MKEETTIKEEPVFMDPMGDVPFKILFGKRHKQNLVYLLQAFLPELEITDLEYRDTEQHGSAAGQHRSTFDLSVQTGSGERVIVEVQLASQEFFAHRSVFYSSYAIQHQAFEEQERQYREHESRGEDKFWDYYFRPIYVIAILGRGWFSGEHNYIERYTIRDDTGKDLNVGVNYIYLSLKDFNKRESECSNDRLSMYAWSFKNMSRLKRKPVVFADKAIDLFYSTANRMSLPTEEAQELERYQYMTTRNDWLVSIAQHKARAWKEGMEEGREKGLEEGREKGLEEGRKKGLEEGRKKGLAEGRAEGRAEGKAEGKAESQKEFARNCKNLGLSISDIAKVTGLSEEEINRL